MEEVLEVVVWMKTLVLMVAISLNGENYQYMPVGLMEENLCLKLAEDLTEEKTLYQHAYCSEYTLAPYFVPKPRSRP